MVFVYIYNINSISQTLSIEIHNILGITIGLKFEKQIKVIALYSFGSSPWMAYRISRTASKLISHISLGIMLRDAIYIYRSLSSNTQRS